ncbi:glycosyltransferase family 8 protein [Citrobacter rodentium]|uniref:UDP-glucose:(Galactosyl) LPS alpha-1,2-glucosyltransferase n=2 Tax=Citrobacter rodentium TaxID=67825 RepID=D2TIX7_CITRI|nr:glycosyltransferase [Citrobacter rodentium]KIQ50538.1 lipopolysaccharide 1,2-glucosyltransferase [Citrobacter rodentium]QBY30479.1 lipopolysaccharide 1,2-glucosyltransferase [Citrobacter rodentium]UHO32150.1 lipopolysaccharide 1,2-glucosyltransferase [Citrobacter rodentium NBRC 105723 = DSM 16636]CBG90889.1 UDP-glucose:(galactosyl) LPS alpha-1,2-glucosyltransferase [Citrobacter rodentium ICC168]HAT8013123.1 lipopolysaccharide 1,2-glucosyltransferase [Citrobacter rodentium NBRC 105723 = DSM 
MDDFPAIDISEFKVFDYSVSSKTSTEVLSIAYGVDTNYLDGVGVSITSILINNRHIDIDFYIIADGYNDTYLQKIHDLAEMYRIKIVLYTINVEKIACLPSTQVWSRAMYFRLFAFKSLSTKLDRLLYLDADVVCKGDISKLLTVNLDNVVAAVVKDVEPMQEKAVVRLSDPELRGKYFNSGVVYANLQKWAEHQLTEKALAILLCKDTIYKYPDQDVLNALLKGMTLFLPGEYNTIYTIKSELRDRTHQKYKRIISEDTLLIHYTGATKPWHKWAVYPSVEYYRKAAKLSPWKDEPGRDAKTIIEYKKRYKHLLVQNHFLSGIIAGVLYLRRKYFHK